jgi:hypothetical protein
MAKVTRKKEKTNVIPTTKNQFKTQKLLSVLNAVYLGGSIEEFVLEINSGAGTIAAVDKSACMFAYVHGEVGNVPDSSIGLKEPGFLMKVLDSVGKEDVEYEVEEDRWLRIEMPTGNIKILLSAPGMIPTAVADYQEPIEKMKAGIQASIALSREVVEKVLVFQNLVKNESIRVFVNGQKVLVGSGKFETRTYSVEVGEIKAGLVPPDFSVTVRGDHLTAILSFFTWEESLPAPIISFGQDSPVLLSRGDDFLWSLSQCIEN